MVRQAVHSLAKSRRLKAMPPISADATPIATRIASAVQLGATAGAAAIWWKTEVSSTQWFSEPIPPTTSVSNDQPSTP